MGERYEEEETEMKCMYCQTEMKKGLVPFHIDKNGIHVILDEVPAWICPQCGEYYFEENEVNSMQELVKSIEKQSKKFSHSAAG